MTPSNKCKKERFPALSLHLLLPKMLVRQQFGDADTIFIGKNNPKIIAEISCLMIARATWRVNQQLI
jgi:hypothetical protein